MFSMITVGNDDITSTAGRINRIVDVVSDEEDGDAHEVGRPSNS